MKYIIADQDEQSSSELKQILDDYQMLEFQGSFTTLEATESSIRGEPPDIAFIRMGKAELNAFRLAAVIRERNQFSKVIFMSSQRDNAVEAFECGADGFLMLPFNAGQIKQLLQRSIEKSATSQMELRE